MSHIDTDLLKPEIIELDTNGLQAVMATVEDTTDIFDDYRMQFRPVPGRPNELFAPWGFNNLLPFKIADLVGADEVTAQNKFFNVLTCYGAGLALQDADGQPTSNADALRFARRSALRTFFLEQVTDCKYYFLAVSVIILSKDGSQINRLVHKDACGGYGRPGLVRACAVPDSTAAMRRQKRPRILQAGGLERTRTQQHHLSTVKQQLNTHFNNEHSI